MSRHRRRRDHRRVLAALSLLGVVATLFGILAHDQRELARSDARQDRIQARVDEALAGLEMQAAELDRQRRYDCLLFTGAALRRLPDDAALNERCIVIGAAAAVDNAGCRPGPIRPDLDTGEAAVASCLDQAASG